MQFDAVVSGAPAQVLFDSGAQGIFISRSYASQVGLRVETATSAPSKATVANGADVAIHGVSVTHLSIQGFSCQVSCWVTDLDSGYDLILGEPWLHKYRAVLSYDDLDVVIRNGRRKFVLRCGSSDGMDADSAAADASAAGQRDTGQDEPVHNESRIPVLSALQMQNLIRVGGQQVFAVSVSEVRAQSAEGSAAQSAGAATGSHDPQPVSDPTVRAVNAVIDAHLAAFADSLPEGLPPDRDIAHTIELEPGAKPPFRPMYRLSRLDLKEVEATVADLLAKGLIQPSTSPFGAPILFVKKKSGELRMCVDYRALNHLTVKNRYPLPRIDDLFDKLQGAVVFTSLDLTSGYHQIKINAEDVPKTAFRTPFGHFEFKVLCFGLTNAPATFQSVMNRVLDPFIGKFVLVYMDDILIYSKNASDHAEHVRLVLEKLIQHKFYAKRTKCEFVRRELAFSGHVVSAEGIKVDPKKVAIVQDWPVPTDVGQLRAFLGVGNYFRRFIQGYSNLVRALNDLLKKDVPYKWTDGCSVAFRGLKEALLNAPVLTLPDFSADAPDFDVWCDASGFGLGAVLLQGGRVISYEARSMTPAERNYTTGEQELLAVIHALRTWRCYLEGDKPVNLMTDHAPNTFLPTQASLSRRQARWSEYLQRFKTLKWFYKPGKTNVADPVSRSPALLSVRTAAAPLVRSHSGEDPLRSASRRGATAGDSEVQSAGAAAGSHDPPSGNLLDRIRAGYAADPYFVNLAERDAQCRFYDSLWLRRGAVIVFADNELGSDLVFEAHDAAAAGHMGINATMKRLTGSYCWSHGNHTMNQHVVQYVRSCDSCQRNKSTNQKPGGLLQPVPVPSRCRCRCAMLLYSHVYEHHGIPDDIVSDRDKLFTSLFFIGLCRLMGTKQRMSTAFHPQTDGQTERTNRTLQEVLRHCVGSMQEDWDIMLAGAELAINSAHHRSVDSTPFMLSFGRHPRLPFNQDLPSGAPFVTAYGERHAANGDRQPAIEHGAAETASSGDTVPPVLTLIGRWRMPQPVCAPLTRVVDADGKVPAVHHLFGDMALRHERTRERLLFAQQRQKQYADQKRREVEFQVFEQVMLSTKNLRMKAPRGGTSKLLPRWMGPFKVIEKVGSVAYRLDLPVHLKMHPVFHVSLLKPYHDSGRVQPPPPPIDIEGEFEFEVERVIDHRWRRHGRAKHAKRELLVRWKGYSDAHDTWEPEDNLTNAADILQGYLTERSKAGDTSVCTPPPPVKRTPRKKSVAAMPAADPFASAAQGAGEQPAVVKPRRGKRGSGIGRKRSAAAAALPDANDVRAVRRSVRSAAHL